MDGVAKFQLSLFLLIIFIYRKTSFLTQIAKTLRQSAGYMIVCKFNQSDPPDTILASGLDTFFEHTLGNFNDESKTNLKNRIEEALGDHVE